MTAPVFDAEQAFQVAESFLEAGVVLARQPHAVSELFRPMALTYAFATEAYLKGLMFLVTGSRSFQRHQLLKLFKELPRQERDAVEVQFQRYTRHSPVDQRHRSRFPEEAHSLRGQLRFAAQTFTAARYVSDGNRDHLASTGHLAPAACKLSAPSKIIRALASSLP
ncbi:hypothetical protein [Deinococcus navajonensis]|uniref:HEPN domain-containing protein n=1 Tax=Deinococcus navajonensis TaxID=309884 RepID=A0ABV8XJS7_9DEIO